MAKLGAVCFILLLSLFHLKTEAVNLNPEADAERFTCDPETGECAPLVVEEKNKPGWRRFYVNPEEKQQAQFVQVDVSKYSGEEWQRAVGTLFLDSLATLEKDIFPHWAKLADTTVAPKLQAIKDRVKKRNPVKWAHNVATNAARIRVCQDLGPRLVQNQVSLDAVSVTCREYFEALSILAKARPV